MNLIKKLGLGTVQFGMLYGISNKIGQTNEENVSLILNFAKKIGIDTLDTATAYGNSEKVLGRNNLNKFKVISKFILKQEKNSISEQLHLSLKSLNISSVYGYLSHKPMDVISNPELWDELVDFKEKGYIKKIGFSFNELKEIDSILSAGFYPDLIQVPFNYLDKRFEKYMIGFKKKGCEIHSRSPFLQGLFFIDTDKLPPFFNEVKPVIIQLQHYGTKLTGMLLKYCIRQPFIDKVIFGVNTLNQLKENIDSVSDSEELMPSLKRIDNKILIPSRWPK